MGSEVRVQCFDFLDLDFLCRAETHLRGSDKLHVPGYTFIGQNRQNVSKKSKRGSGGVGIL